MIINIKTSKKHEMVDVTDKVRDAVRKCGRGNGVVFVYARHATGAIVINENADPNLCDDILGVLKEIVPEHNDYKHDRIDNNAAAHIRAVLLGSGKFVPFERRELMLGKWQNIFFVELDGPREREIIITILENQKA